MIRNSVLLLSGLLMVSTVGITAPAVAETASEEIDARAKIPIGGRLPVATTS